jgi:hypothetical protein
VNLHEHVLPLAEALHGYTTWGPASGGPLRPSPTPARRAA